VTRVTRLSAAITVVSTALFAGYLALRLRSLPPASHDTARTVAIVSLVAWCWLTYRIVKRILAQWLE
jgi:hypothetical protein